MQLSPAQRQNIYDHAPEVQVILKKGPHARAVLKNASPKLVRAITHMVQHGHHNGLISGPHAQRHAAKIRKLVSPSTSVATKTRVVQGGGFLGFLGNILGGLASTIFGAH